MCADELDGSKNSYKTFDITKVEAAGGIHWHEVRMDELFSRVGALVSRKYAQNCEWSESGQVGDSNF